MLSGRGVIQLIGIVAVIWAYHDARAFPSLPIHGPATQVVQFVTESMNYMARSPLLAPYQCRPSDSTPIPVAPVVAIHPTDTAALCANPAAYICANKITTYNLEDELRARRNAVREAMLTDSRYSDLTLLPQEGNEIEFQDCTDAVKDCNCTTGVIEDETDPLMRGGWNQCHEAFKRELDNDLFQTQVNDGSGQMVTRQEKARRIIDRAKLDMLGSLRVQLAAIADQSSPQYQAMSYAISRVESVNVQWGETNNFPRNNSYMSPDGTLIVSGQILEVDQNPDSFYFTMLHELGHLFDPCAIDNHFSVNDADYFTRNPDFNENPWGSQIRCMHREDSAGLHRLGYSQCIAPALRRWEGMARAREGAVLSSFVDRHMGLVRGHWANGHHHMDDGSYRSHNCKVEFDTHRWDSRVLPDSQVHHCKEPQAPESFPDWMAAEAMAQKLRMAREAGGAQMPVETAQFHFRRMAERYCTHDIQTQVRNSSSLRAARNRYTDEHSLGADRINNIIFANPEIATAVGCPSRPSVLSSLSSRDRGPSNAHPAYCGPNLVP